MTLTELANKYNCDKGTVAYEAHGYTEEYGKIIPQTGKCHLLEIGIWHGDSLKMWNEYNPDIDVDAIDIDPAVLNYTKDLYRYYIHIGDQSDPMFLAGVTYGHQYDFIIDDGSHSYEDIMASFKFLYSKVKLGGYYFIEDLHASQAQRERVLKGTDDFIRDNKLNFLRKLVCNDKLLIIQRDTSNH